MDPELPVLQRQWIDSLGSFLREESGLDQWVRASSATNGGIPLGMNFIEMDMFWREALTQSVNAFVKDQNEAQKEVMDSMTRKIEELKPNQSLLSGTPKPSFTQY